MTIQVTREQAQDFEDAHIDGMHDEVPREGCPMCEERKGIGPDRIPRKDEDDGPR